ncbi:ammonia permease [Bacillus cereus]|uniref:ammonia permease n=1 Tax=Bacillus cereus TaxID=1396 RepID=UPI00240570B2|nr:ammonia permease [Bacillus cereus]MDF9652394.1 ammonia permease [Bacillus cereus]
MFGILTWMILALTLMVCEFIVGIFLIIFGIKCRKSLTIIAGFISISLIVVPIICIGYGIDLEGMIPISGTLYWGLFSLAGLLAIISGRQISSIRAMGTILFITGLCSVAGYQLLYLTA